jgi:amino acid transporter
MAVTETEERSVESPDDGQEHEHLPKTMRWVDAFALGLNSPGSVVAAVGFSVAALGGWWAMALWAAAVVVAFLASWIYTELAGMFPGKSGGIAMYAEEGWRRYSTFVGPLATWGYWVGWSSGVAVFAIAIATIVQAQFFSSATWVVHLGITSLTFPKLVASAIVVMCFVINIRGVRFTVKWGYATGITALFVLVMLSVVPFLTGHVHLSRVNAHLGASGPSGLRIALVWLYVMFWTTGGMEMPASFTPEFRSGYRDTRKAILVLGLVALVTLSLMPVAISGVLGEHAIAANPSSFMVPVFHAILPTAAWIPTLILCGDFLLVIIAGDADGSRTLFGMATDRMTLRTFGHLNKRNVPSHALAASLAFNLFLVIFVSNSLAIISAANLGYVLAHLFALSGFLLLRKDRPTWPRPLRLSTPWIPVAFMLVAILLAATILGATGFGITGYGGTKELIIGVAILAVAWLFFAIRRVFQDKTGIQWREDVPLVPELAEEQG